MKRNKNIEILKKGMIGMILLAVLPLTLIGLAVLIYSNNYHRKEELNENI